MNINRLTAFWLQDKLIAAEAKIRTLEQQRDELLAICKRVVEYGIGGNDIRDMKKAIAKVEKA